MNIKMLKEDIRTGQVDLITIKNVHDGVCLFAHKRKTHNRFKIDRTFPTMVSAFKCLDKMILLPPISGLMEEYRKPPSVTIIYTRGIEDEENQHESTQESKGVSQREPSSPTE